jgi:hypothetical protein
MRQSGEEEEEDPEEEEGGFEEAGGRPREVGPLLLPRVRAMVIDGSDCQWGMP